MSMPAGSGPFLQWIATCTANLRSDRSGNTGFVGNLWAAGLPQFSMGNLLLPPNSNYVNCNSGVTGTGIRYPSCYKLSSFHPGGANILMCDGSGRFLKNSISQPMVWALGSRAQGEVISADAY
jgi:prepilin-type processing-associated H-X9-DG protein